MRVMAGFVGAGSRLWQNRGDAVVVDDRSSVAEKARSGGVCLSYQVTLWIRVRRREC